MINFFKTDNSEQLYKELLKDYLNEGKIQKIIDESYDIKNVKNEILNSTEFKNIKKFC